jgi:hypothetical protein
VPPEEEEAGLDVGEHGEIAYGLLAEAEGDSQQAVAGATVPPAQRGPSTVEEVDSREFTG